MSLDPGTTLSPNSVTAKIGEGGDGLRSTSHETPAWNATG